MPPRNLSQLVDLKNDSLIEIVFKEMINLKDPLTALLFCGEELLEIRGQKKRGQIIVDEAKQTLRMLQTLFEEIKEKSGDLRRAIGTPEPGQKIYESRYRQSS